MESFNGELRDDLLHQKVFETLREAEVLIERWKREYNQFRPRSGLGYGPSVPEAFLLRTQARNSSP